MTKTISRAILPRLVVVTSLIVLFFSGATQAQIQDNMDASETSERRLAQSSDVTKATEENVPTYNNNPDLTVSEIVLLEAKSENPELAKYVDDEGAFDIRSAAKDIFESTGCCAADAVQRAQEMEQEWLEAYNAKSEEVTSRV